MQIWLEKKHGCLLPFSDELKKFTLITGLNGSGKSQLLAAIRDGHIKNDLVQSPGQTQLAVLFTAHDFGREAEGGGGLPFDDLSVREDLIRKTALYNKPLRTKWLEWASLNEMTIAQLEHLTFQNLNPKLDGSSVTDVNLDLQRLLRDLRAQAYPLGTDATGARNPDFSELLISAEQRTRLPYFLLTEEWLREESLGRPPMFQISIGQIFSQYRDFQLLNDLRKVRRLHGEATVEPMEIEEFNRQYGRPPWDVLNMVLDDMGIDAKFTPPNRTELAPSLPRLTTADGEQFALNDLSSGEKVILKLAVCGYLAKNNFYPTTRPKLLLLDEVDAPLHPAMARIYLDVINDILIGEFGMHVIASTHSPSTVAQCNQERIYVMEKGRSGLQSIPKDQAIAALSAGVPTLSVSMSDRRQVFTESPVEAKNLEALYQILKPKLASPLSLQFIATGPKYQTSSKADVIRIVNDLVSAENQTVFGLVDWDLCSKPSDRIKVIAEGKRYALENIILDPVIIAAELYRLAPNALRHYGLDDTISVYDLRSIDAPQWQKLADSVTSRVLGSPPIERVSCGYHGGMFLDLDVRYLKHPAHPLEDLIVKAYPVFEKIKDAGSGKLIAHMTSTTLTKMPELVPLEIETAFKDLLA